MDKRKHGGDRKSIVGRIGLLRSEVAETASKSEAILYLAAKEERFAQAIARGRSQTDAAIDAGYAVLSAHVQGSRLMKKDKIKARVVQLCSGTSATTADVREEHLAQLISLREAAMSRGQISAAIKAEELRGKVLGLYIEQSVVADISTHSSLDDANPTELRSAIQSAIDKLGLIKTINTIDVVPNSNNVHELMN